MNKFIQKLYLSVYKTLSLTFFITLLLIIIGYASIVVFYITSNSWGTPLILSPSQTKVLAFQPQVATLRLNLNRQKSEMQTAVLTKRSILEQLIYIDQISIKVEEAIVSEKRRAQFSASSVDKLVASKKTNIAQSAQTLEMVKSLNAQVEDELKAGLITSDQASQRRISTQSAVNSYTDLNVSAVQMEIQAAQLREYSLTLGGANKSLSALAPTKQLMELATLRTQLKLQLDTSERNLEIVRKSAAADNIILQAAMDSPYYSALWAVTPVIFIPYSNLNYAEAGQKVYDCRLQIIICRQVGTLIKIYDSEEYAKHPLFKTDLKGRLATVIFTDKKAANSSVLFLGSKPLFI